MNNCAHGRKREEEAEEESVWNINVLVVKKRNWRWRRVDSGRFLLVL